MIAGPAVLTTLITLARTHGYALTVTAYVLNLVIVWAALRWASLVGRLLGEAGGRAICESSQSGPRRDRGDVHPARRDVGSHALTASEFLSLTHRRTRHTPRYI